MIDQDERVGKQFRLNELQADSEARSITPARSSTSILAR
jgi:hypothetical protein